MKKPELLDWLHGKFQQWEVYLDQIGPTHMDQPGVNGDWSIKDLIAHMTGWNRWLVDRLQAAQRREPKPPPPWPGHLQTEEEINAWIYESNRRRSVGEVMDEMRQVYRQLLAVIGDLPDEVRIEQIDPAYHLVWVDDQRFLVSEFFDHFRDDHESDVQAWLARAGKPL
jgi:hypothetical protein